MTESELISANTPEIIRFVTSKIGRHKLMEIFTRVIKNPPLVSFADPVINQAVAIEETARKLAEKIIKKNYINIRKIQTKFN